MPELRESVRSGVVTGLVLLGLFAFGASIAAQGVGELSGQVVEEGTGRLLPGAAVQLLELGLEETSSRSGAFFVSDIRPGDVTVRVSLGGFVSVVEKVSILPDERSLVRFELPRLSAALEELLVVGEVQSGPAERSARDITPDGGRASSAAGLLAELIPGLDLRRNSGAAGGGADTRMRGPSSLSLSNEPLVYLNGVRVSIGSMSGDARSSAGPHTLEQIPASIVKRIRILRGPSAAARYPDSSNGVILIETR